MGYYNYHAKAMNLIKSGHCVGAKILKKHKNVEPALVLFFDCHRAMPIREYKWHIYLPILSSHNVKITAEYEDPLNF